MLIVTCHTIILDNRRPHERKSCSKDSCSKYTPSFHNDHHWPSFFGKRKDTVHHQSTVQDVDDIDSTASSSFSKKDIQDIGMLNSELESVDGQRNVDDNHYSKGNDVSSIGKRRKRRGINEYGIRRFEMNGNHLTLFRQQQGDNRIRMRNKRSLKEESKLERRRMKCCQRYMDGKLETRESDTGAEGNPHSLNPTEFHQRFGSLPLPPPLHPPYQHPFFLPIPFIPNVAFPFNNMHQNNHDQERLNSIHFNRGPPANHEIYRLDPMIHQPFFGPNYYGNIPKVISGSPFPPPPTLPIPSVDQNKSELEGDSAQGQGQQESGERSDEMSVDEEEEEKRKIDFELERSRNIMLMGGQYQQYQPWIHGPIIPIF